MSVDILQHKFVPHHEILPKKEAKETLESMGVQKQNLPKILLSDPVIKKIGGKVGDVVKIVRKSPTAGETIYLRLVV